MTIRCQINVSLLILFIDIDWKQTYGFLWNGFAAG